jgi:putative tricarboxylic transport membrane protein
VALGAAAAAEASTFDVAFLTDPVGPKALPYLAAAILVLAGGRVALRAGVAAARARPARAHEPGLPEAPGRARLPRIAAAAGAFLAYAAVLPWLGFFASTTLVVALLSELYGAPRPHGLLAAALLTGTLWVLFVHLLGLPLPAGTLWIR